MGQVGTFMGAAFEESSGFLPKYSSTGHPRRLGWGQAEYLDPASVARFISHGDITPAFSSKGHSSHPGYHGQGPSHQSARVAGWGGVGKAENADQD